MPFIGRIATSASQDRLERLIEERLKPGADKQRIDERIWDLFGEDWAVMFTDLSGFSRRVAEFGIIHFLQTIHEAQRILVPVIEAHDGIMLKTEGDSFLVIFRSATRALECALAMQRAVRDYDREREEAEKILLCVGLGCGRVLRIGDHDVFGAEVNAAAKLGEDTAKAWDVLVTGAVRQAVEQAGQAAPGGLAEPISFQPLTEAPPGAEAAFRVRYEL
jgi:class 3 adenylate cyclase